MCAGWSPGYLTRVLGLRPGNARERTYTNADGQTRTYAYAATTRETISHAVAERLCRAMDLCMTESYV